MHMVGFLSLIIHARAMADGGMNNIEKPISVIDIKTVHSI